MDKYHSRGEGDNWLTRRLVISVHIHVSTCVYTLSNTRVYVRRYLDTVLAASANPNLNFKLVPVARVNGFCVHGLWVHVSNAMVSQLFYDQVAHDRAALA